MEEWRGKIACGMWLNHGQKGKTSMQFAKLSAPSLKELFVQELENMILSGRLAIGTQLPPERELAQSMQISRAVVNAGLNEMERKGFLEVRPRVGTFVADYRRKGTADTLLSIMKYNGGRLQRDDIRSILEIKEVLDRLAAQLAIQKITDEEIARLRTLLDALQTADAPESAAAAAFSFYHELALISGNTLVPLIYYSFKSPILSLWERFCIKYGAAALYQNAARLFEAVAARDTGLAEQIIEASIAACVSGPMQIYSE